MAIPLRAPEMPSARRPLGEDHALLCRAVREVGALALRRFREGARHWEKAPGEPVSEADLAVDAHLRRIFAAERPGYGWLSEESGAAPGAPGAPVFVVDPIDGTRAFVRGRAEFVIAAALIAAGRPVAGAVFNPVTDEFFEAIAGGGPRCNGERLHVSSASTLEGQRLLVSRREFEAIAGNPAFAGCAVEPMHSIAYKMALVAAGRAAAALCRREVADWDVAAAHLLVAEAGGGASDAKGAPLCYGKPEPHQAGVLAANPILHALIIQRL